MRSKWEYIRDGCMSLGFRESMKIADEIETLLKEIYGDTKTVKWMRDYILYIKEEEPTARDISIIAGSVEYCIACMEDGCTTCRFRKRGGGCGTDNTLFRYFLYALDREGGLP